MFVIDVKISYQFSFHYKLFAILADEKLIKTDSDLSSPDVFDL